MSPTDVVTQEKTTPARTKVNQRFSIQVATVNGSGSQTANLVLLRSILLMGIPVSARTCFPRTSRAAHVVHHRASSAATSGGKRKSIPRGHEPGNGKETR